MKCFIVHKYTYPIQEAKELDEMVRLQNQYETKTQLATVDCFSNKKLMFPHCECLKSDSLL